MSSFDPEALLASIRAEYSEMAAKAAQGDRSAISWIKGRGCMVGR